MGTADLVFAGPRLAVFVDGCFWHGCPEHFKLPRTNPGYWGPKIERNRARDAEANEALGLAGWTVVRVWEHEDMASVAKRLVRLVQSRRKGQ